VAIPKGIPPPETPQNWNVEEMGELFENVCARYVWNVLYTANRGCVNMLLWRKEGAKIITKNWYMIVAIYEDLLKAWSIESENFFAPDITNVVGCEQLAGLYALAIAKRAPRRKSTTVRKYENVDEYVDNMYLNE
jgi:hypothetical protein